MSHYKQNLRNRLRQRRKDFVELNDAKEASHRILSQLIYLKFKPCSVAIYWPMEFEVDTRPMLEWLHVHGFSIGLPHTKFGDHILEFYRWTPETELELNIYRTWTCKERSEKIKPRLIIAPLLGFDPHGHRLGQGGGYYDATLAYFRSQHAVVALGLAYDCQLIHAVPTDLHDQRLDYVLTPQTIWKFR